MIITSKSAILVLDDRPSVKLLRVSEIVLNVVFTLLVGRQGTELFQLYS